MLLQGEDAVRTAVRKLGNSSGVIIPKSLLAEAGIAAGDAVDLSVEEGRIILEPARHRPRAGWAEASRELAAAGDDGLVWPEFGNADDETFTW
jgi:antitoxin MazE